MSKTRRKKASDHELEESLVKMIMEEVDVNFEGIRAVLGNPEVDVNWASGERADALLHTACRLGHTEVVRDLLAHPDIDVNKPNAGNATPMYIACQEGHRDVVHLLMCDPRVDVNQTPEDNVTPLSIACDYCHEDVVELLILDPRIDVNLSDLEGICPLWSMSHNGLLRPVQVLLAGEKPVQTGTKPIAGPEIWQDTTPAEVGLQQTTLHPDDFESNEDYLRSVAYGPQIANLIFEYDANPVATKARLRELPQVRGSACTTLLLPPGSLHAHTSLPPSSPPLLALCRTLYWTHLCPGYLCLGRLPLPTRASPSQQPSPEILSHCLAASVRIANDRVQPALCVGQGPGPKAGF